MLASGGILLARLPGMVGRRVASTASTVDSREMDTFRELSKEWYDESSAFKALYALNKVRVPWIKEALLKDKDKQSLIGHRIVDIGCGGGLLSQPLAKLGADVHGLDASPAVIEAAERFLKRNAPQCGSLQLHCNNVLDFSKENDCGFDAVVASEIIEHVANLESFIDACVRLARPGAPLFFTTINKTVASNFLAVWLAEEVFRIVPKGVHDWNKFVEPELLCKELERHGCEVRFSGGLFYNPVANEWSWTSSKLVNYAVMAVKT